jgi:hypothetical protein
MARPHRNDVDYFPFLCKTGNTSDYIEQVYGNDGFAVWVKLLRELAKTDYHYLNLSVKQKSMIVASKCKVSEDVLFSIIGDLVDLEEFDAEFWNDHKIIWSRKFTDSIEDAYKKRSNKIFKREELLQLFVSLGIRKPISEGINSPVNPQSKEEESKEEETKLNVGGDEIKISIVPKPPEGKKYSIAAKLPNAENASFEDYEHWTEDVIKGNDSQFEQLIMKERIPLNGALAELAKSYLSLLAQYPKKCPPDQHRFRVALLGHIRENINKNDNGNRTTNQGTSTAAGSVIKGGKAFGSLR